MKTKQCWLVAIGLCWLLAWPAAAVASATATTTCPPQGKMPFPGGKAPCPSPDVPGAPLVCPATPTYEDLLEEGTLWPCPTTDPNDPEACCGGDAWSYCAPCDPSLGDCTTNALCFPDRMGMLQTTGTCRPLPGCFVTPRFNWIIGACQGETCGDYDEPYATALRGYKDVGTRAVLNYVAAYRFETATGTWVLDPVSSFNTDGAKGAYDLIKPWGGLAPEDAWLSPQPGGAGGWSWGYYPAGVEGLGPPAMLFVISTEQSWNFTWFMLNQLTLDRGPTVSYPADLCSQTNVNCWSAGNAGEIDFLQPPWTTSYGRADDYRRLYATSDNENGRCFSASKGETCQAGGQWYAFGDRTANSYFLGGSPDQGVPYVFAAVVDRIGTFIYRIPTSDNDEALWLSPEGGPGLSRKTAACRLAAKPKLRPHNDKPPCDDRNPYCALFLPNCQAAEWAAGYGHGGANEGCYTNRHQGFGKNWFNNFANTGQWLWPENGRRSVVNFQPDTVPPQVMPWNFEMEAWLVDWTGKPIVHSGCCTLGQGFCPHLWQDVANAIAAQGGDPGRCFGYPWNGAQPTPFTVPFDTASRLYTFTDTQGCQQTSPATGCLPGPANDYANHCRQCTLDPRQVSPDLPACPEAYRRYIEPGPDVPKPPPGEDPTGGAETTDR